MMTKNLLNEQFRVSPLFILREWNLLGQQEKELLIGLYDEAEVYGIFSPVSPETRLTMKVAYRDVALICLHLEGSVLLPHYLAISNENSFNKTIAQLVLDNILEIEWNGNFVSGSQAIEAIFGKFFFKNEDIPGHLAFLSKEGVRYALHLDCSHMRMISRRLYTYNTMPWDPSLKKNFNENTDTRDFVFSNSRTSLTSLLNKEWYLINDPAKDHWLGWTRRHFADTSFNEIDRGTFKLYISPVIQDLPQVMSVALPILTSSNAFSFKIGNGIHGLLRPDKMVAYFNNKSSLLQAAGELKNKFSDCRVQGVPFTAQMDDKGILSWGFDPPGSDVLEAIEGGSWRCRVTDQIALAIVQVKTEKLDHQQAIDFIGSKLFVAGIDPYNWTPLN